MNKDNGRSFWEYPANLELGIDKGSGPGHFVPADWMNSKALEGISFVLKSAEKIGDSIILAAHKVKEISGSVHIKANAGKIFERASTD